MQRGQQEKPVFKHPSDDSEPEVSESFQQVLRICAIMGRRQHPRLLGRAPDFGRPRRLVADGHGKPFCSSISFRRSWPLASDTVVNDDHVLHCSFYPITE